MNIYVTFYNTTMIASLVVSLGVAFFMWRHRRFPGAVAMITLSLATFVWAAGFFLDTLSDTLQRQLFFTSIAYFGSMSVAPAWFGFSLSYVRGGKLLSRKLILLLSVVPVITMTLIWTNNWHHLMWSNEHLVVTDGFLTTAKSYGPWFWVALAHNYGLIAAGMVLLIGRLFRGSLLYARQAFALIFAVLLPLLWNIIFVFDLWDLPRRDLTPAMFAFSGLILALGLVRFQLFRVVPFAQRFIIRELSEGILVFDRERRLAEINPTARRMLGAETSVIGLGLDKLKEVSPLFSAFSLEPTECLEIPVESPEGTVYYEMNTTPLHDSRGGPLGWATILHDITWRKKSMQQLTEAYTKEQELRQSLQTEVQKRVQYTRALVHELKTPLTPIIATSEILMSELTEEPWNSMARNINRGGRNLNRKVDELLDLARSEIGTLKVELKDVFPADIMRDAVRELEPSTEPHKHRLEIDIVTPLPAIRADGARIRQVICNLVDNALKFSTDEGMVVLRARHEDDLFIVEVEDNGPGLSEADQTRLFQVYERSDTDRRRLSGLGMGLALSKSLIELHGGRIWVKSQEDYGSTFGFSIPARGPAR